MAQTPPPAASGGIGFTSLLLLLFVALKLCGVITWSWWWVLSPFWIPLGLVLAFFLVCLAFWGLVLYGPKRRRGNLPLVLLALLPLALGGCCGDKPPQVPKQASMFLGEFNAAVYVLGTGERVLLVWYGPHMSTTLLPPLKPKTVEE